ncbi:MAG: hypothetical protein ACTSV7_14850 [Candidatus Baldrarchaeia archaeon]
MALRKGKNVKKTLGIFLLIMGIISFYYSGGFGLVTSFFQSFLPSAIFVPEFEEHRVVGEVIIKETCVSAPEMSPDGFCSRIKMLLISKNQVEFPPNSEVKILLANKVSFETSLNVDPITRKREYDPAEIQPKFDNLFIEASKESTIEFWLNDNLLYVSKIFPELPEEPNLAWYETLLKEKKWFPEVFLFLCRDRPCARWDKPREYWVRIPKEKVLHGINTFKIVVNGKTIIAGEFYKEPDECTIPPGYALATEDFKAGTTISKDSFARPVVAFCNSYPIMKMDSSGKTLNEFSTKELELLRKGGYVTVPSGQVWRIMYVAKISDLTRACKPGEYVDEEGECIPLPAFEYYCSSGTYDPDKHACLVQPVARCIEGSYNEATGMCEKIISPEEVIIRCPEGSELKVLDDGTKVCIFEPVPYCEKGVLTQDELGREICAYFPEIVNLAEGQRNIEIGEIPDELHVRTYTCPLVDERMIFMETFAGGKEVNQYSFRYPVNFFCKVHPVIITTADGRTYKRAEIYDRIVAGETLTIPEDETWTFFYVGYANQQLPLVCKEGALRISEDKIECVVQPGVVHVCSEGQFDPVRGLCVIQPESRAVCESGYYDAEKKVCIWHPPLQAVCEKGLYNPDTGFCEWKPKTIVECEGNYDEERGVCIVVPTTIIKCQRGYYDKKADVCRYTPKEKIVCKEPYVYNPQTQKCEYKPPEDVKCEMGVWNEQTQACEYAGEIRYVCEEGTFDKATKTCIVKPPIYYKCDKGTYNKDRGVCEYTPTAEAVCEKGEYDPATDKCIYIPREYIVCEGIYDEETGKCIIKMTPEYECAGEIVGDKCIIKPKPKIICPGKSYWDEEQKACILEGKVKIVCPEGAELVGGVCLGKDALVVSYGAMQVISAIMIAAGALLLFL